MGVRSNPLLQQFHQVSAVNEIPLSEIEGIGPATETLLQKAGAYYALDLLRATAASLHPFVASVASLEQVSRWRMMAAFLQVKGMNVQWAEALAASGVETIEQLSRKSLSQLETVFQEAEGNGIIPDVPDHDQIAEIIHDATVLFCTGSLSGAVRDPQGKPVTEASVRIGFVEATTNAKGRFRLLRIPLGRSVSLVVSKNGYAKSVVNVPPVATDPELISSLQLQLVPEDANPAPVIRLSELGGDRLPEMVGYEVRTERKELADLQHGDVLIVQKFYESAPDALLVSRYRDWFEDAFIVREYRVPRSQLSSEVQEKDHLSVSDQGFRKIEFSPRHHRISLAIKRFNKEYPQPDYALSAAEKRAHNSARIEFLKQEGVLGQAPTN